MMGEFADMALSETMDMEDLRLSYRMGDMTDDDAYAIGIIDELGSEDYRPMIAKTSADSANKTCRACGRRNLKWAETPHGWRLHDGKTLHVCDQYTRNKA